MSSSVPSPVDEALLVARFRPLAALGLAAGVAASAIAAVVYLVFVALMGSLLGWVGIQVLGRAANGEPLIGVLAWQLGGWAVSILFWVLMVRVMMPRRMPESAGVLVTRVTQPALVEAIGLVCRRLGVAHPQEVWLDTSVGVRWRWRNGLRGWIDGEVRLTLGLPLIRALSARELSVVLASEISPYSSGVRGQLLPLLEELQSQQYRAMRLRDLWHPAGPTVASEGRIWDKFWCRWCDVFTTASRIPFGLTFLGPLR